MSHCYIAFVFLSNLIIYPLQLKRYEENDKPLFYPIGVVRLATMSLFTFGFYDFIWFYRQWKTFSEATGYVVSLSLVSCYCTTTTSSSLLLSFSSPMYPGVRATFMWLYFHALAKRVEYFCGTHGLQKPKPLALTLAFLVQLLCSLSLSPPNLQLSR